MRKLRWSFILAFSALPAGLLVYGFVNAFGPPAGAAVAALASPAAVAESPRAPLLLALGDSLTRGTGDPAGKGYVGLLADGLRAKWPGLRMENLAVDGLESDGLRETLTHPHALELASAATAIVVSIGGNDLSHALPSARVADPREALDGARTRLMGNLEEILTALRGRNPRGKILLLLLYDPFSGAAGPRDVGSDVIVDWNAAIEKTALRRDVRPIPLLDLFEGRPDRLSSDHFHPNPEGYGLIARRMLESW